MRSPAASAIRLPVAYEPVKKTPSIACLTSSAPITPPPTTGANTSRGTPAAWNIFAISRPVSVANSDGL